MTSQVEEVNVEELRAEAKALNASGWQACKDPDKLKAKIEEAKLKNAERKKAPKMQVASVGENTRAKLIAKLEADDPESKYLTQAASISSEEINAKGLEVVKKSNGDIMYHGSDIVCRTDKRSYYDWQNARSAHATEAMKAIDKDLSTEGGGRRIQSVTENVKQGFSPS